MPWQIKIYGDDLGPLEEQFKGRHVITNALHKFVVVTQLDEDEERELTARGYKVSKGMNFSLDVGEDRE